MPTVKADMEHSLSQDVAVERIKGLLNKLKQEYGDMIKDLNENWNGNTSTFSFKIMGMSVSGNLYVNPSSISFTGQIPLAALPFKKTIEDKIREEAGKLLN